MRASRARRPLSPCAFHFPVRPIFLKRLLHWLPGSFMNIVKLHTLELRYSRNMPPPPPPPWQEETFELLFELKRVQKAIFSIQYERFFVFFFPSVTVTLSFTISLTYWEISSFHKGYAPVNSSCAHPPPGQLRGIYTHCQSRGSGISLPKGYPGLLTHVVSDSKSKRRRFYRKRPVVCHWLACLSRTGPNCGGF